MLPDNTDDIILRALTISANLLSNSDRYTEVMKVNVSWSSKHFEKSSFLQSISR